MRQRLNRQSAGTAPTAPQSVKPALLAVTAIVLLTAAIRAPALAVPFERDEGEYAYIGWRLGYGELPYRDWIDQKPPGIFWVYRAALALPLNSIVSVHFAALVVSAVTACALYFLAGQFMSRRWATAAALLFAVLSADPLAQGTVANTELFMLCPLTLSQLAFFKAMEEGRRGRIPLAVVCGALTGIAVAFKPVAAVNWLFLIAMSPLFASRGSRLRGALAFAGWSTAGAATVWAGIVAYFALRHGLADLVYNVFTHNLEYIQVMPWSQRIARLGRTLSSLSRSESAIWVFAATGFVALGKTGKWKELVFLGGWTAASIIGASASGYFFAHYFQQVVPPLAVAAALGGEAIFNFRPWGVVPAWGRAVALGLLLAVLPAVAMVPFLFLYSPAEAVRKLYPGDAFAEMPVLAARLAAATGAEDRVFVFGAEPEVLFYAKRVSATRYIFLFPLYGPYADARERQNATAEEVSAAHPAAAIVMPNRLFNSPGAEQFFSAWSQSYVQEHFTLDTCLTVDRRDVYHLVPAHDGQASVAHGQTPLGGLFVRNRASP